MRFPKLKGPMRLLRKIGLAKRLAPDHANLTDYAALLHLVPGDIAFDVGANTGRVARTMASVAKHVYAFEPNEAVVAELARERTANITIISKAVCDEIGTAPFYLDERDSLGAVASSLLRLRGMGNCTRVVNVATTTLDRFCDDFGIRPDFVKIDVEGAEPEVIKGASATIDRCRPKIVFELWESHWKRFEPMIRFLTKYYYLIRLSDGSDAVAFYSGNPVNVNGVDDILCLPLHGTGRSR